MIDHKDRSFPDDRYRRCKSSDDLTKSDGFRKNLLSGKSMTFGNSETDVDSPRVLRRAEKYRMAAKKSEMPRSDSLGYKSGSLFFEPDKSRSKETINKMVNATSANHLPVATVDESRRSSVVFVYSGKEQGAKKSFKQWSERPAQNFARQDTVDGPTTSPRVRKKSHTQHIKERVTSFLQNTSVLRRRKKGVDYSGILHARGSSTMHHTKSLPNFLDGDLRPRSQSAEAWGMPSANSIWSLASDKDGRKISQTSKMSSSPLSNPGSPVTKIASIARSTSMATTRKGLENQVLVEDKAQSFVDIASKTKDNSRKKFSISNSVEGDESDDDLSSYGSESSPYASPRTKHKNKVNGIQYSSVLMEQVPALYTPRFQPYTPSKVAVDSRRFPSSVKFQNIRIREIADEELRSNLEGKQFEPDQVKIWSQLISEGIKERVTYALCGQFKIIAQVYIGCLRDKGMSAATQCTFQQGNDSFVISSYRGSEMFAFASVYALDFRCEIEVDMADECNALLNS